MIKGFLYFNKEHGINHVKLLKTIKNSIDPYNLMNPNKMLPSLLE
jgi:FAD/FMN-containing dehydrogenase